MSSGEFLGFRAGESVYRRNAMPLIMKRWRLGLGFRAGSGPRLACVVACIVCGSSMRLLIESTCCLDLAVRIRMEFVTLERTAESCFRPREFGTPLLIIGGYWCS